MLTGTLAGGDYPPQAPRLNVMPSVPTVLLQF